MSWLPCPIILFAFIGLGAAQATTVAVKKRALRHREQSEVVIAEPSLEVIEEHLSTAPASPPSQKVAAVSSEQQTLVSSMQALLQSEDQFMEPQMAERNSKTGKLRRKLVDLIWLEKVYQQSLNTMHQHGFVKKLLQSNPKSQENVTAATKAVVGTQETRVFIPSMFQKTVRDELKEIHARQQDLLNQIAASSRGEDSDDDERKEDSERRKAHKAETDRIKAEEKKRAAAKAEDENGLAAKILSTSSVFVIAMVSLNVTLIMVVCGIAAKVYMNVSRRRSELA